jgi:hypothetical protein
MTRPLRIQYPNAWYHVMNKGRRSEVVFLEEKDYLEFINLVKYASLLTGQARRGFLGTCR